MLLLVAALPGNVSLRLAHAAASVPSAKVGAPWHEDASGGRQRLDAVADRTPLNRSGGKSTDDALPTAPWAPSLPARPPAAHTPADAAAPAEAAFAAYRARAPPRLA